MCKTTFTEEHRKLLELFQDPKGWFSSHNTTPLADSPLEHSFRDVIERAIPEARDRRNYYDDLWEDLRRADLVDAGGLDTRMTRDGVMGKRTTDKGDDYLSA